MQHRYVGVHNTDQEWTQQSILCINIAVPLRRKSHNWPVPYNELNTYAALLEGPVVETRAQHNLFLFVMVRKPPGLVQHETQMKWQRRELGTPGVGAERLNACGTGLFSSCLTYRKFRLHFPLIITRLSFIIQTTFIIHLSTESDGPWS